MMDFTNSFTSRFLYIEGNSIKNLLELHLFAILKFSIKILSFKLILPTVSIFAVTGLTNYSIKCVTLTFDLAFRSAIR